MPPEPGSLLGPVLAPSERSKWPFDFWCRQSARNGRSGLRWCRHWAGCCQSAWRSKQSLGPAPVRALEMAAPACSGAVRASEIAVRVCVQVQHNVVISFAFSRYVEESLADNVCVGAHGLFLVDRCVLMIFTKFSNTAARCHRVNPG